MLITPEKRDEFLPLFTEFAGSYPATDAGKKHMRAYASAREAARVNYAYVVRASEAGEDITDAVLTTLLPHQDTAANRRRGAWVHIAPAVTGDVRPKFEASGWTRPDEWPRVARAIFDFVVSCVETPGSFPEACTRFAELPFTKGFQSGFLTPILNALAPQNFIIMNNKSRRVINYLAGRDFSQKITDYAGSNAVGLELIEDLGEILDTPDLGEMPPADAFDMFVHWAAAIKKVQWARKRGKQLESGIEYWKIAPGEKAWNWDECREGGYIAIGWSDFGDVRGLSRAEFVKLRDSMVASHADWTKGGADQIWRFTRIPVGSVIVANRGTTKVLGIGTVTGECYFAGGGRHPHRLPVDWFDVGLRSVDEGGWRRTMVKLDAEKVEEIQALPTADASSVRESPAPWAGEPRVSVPAFDARAFELLDQLHADPSKASYMKHKDELREYIVRPFKALVEEVARLVPDEISGKLETKKRVFSQFLKQGQIGDNACWDFYWGAFYPAGRSRPRTAQLSFSIQTDRFVYGFYIGEYGREERTRFIRNLRSSPDRVRSLVSDLRASHGFVLGSGSEELEPGESGPAPDEWLNSTHERELVRVSAALSRDRATAADRHELATKIASAFVALYPLVLMSVENDPWPAIDAYLGSAIALPDAPAQPQARYELSDFASETGFTDETISTWMRRLRRKRHVIFQGPPGTGKTFVAERLARLLVSGTNGFMEVVQFHPSYAYEDFVQGIRPKPTDHGLAFELEPGRFLEFCRRARETAPGDPCVLIIDEINRAHLSRVFGELMFLLEYRHQSIPLASGGAPFRIPENVYLIGTMNTADRSIALVDHALRRRFSFIRLGPEYEVLRSHLGMHGLPGDSLVRVLQRVNTVIGDPNYEVGISYFMKDGASLTDTLPDIWQGEIEPYLEEYFYDAPTRVEPFRWEALIANELSAWAR